MSSNYEIDEEEFHALGMSAKWNHEKQEFYYPDPTTRAKIQWFTENHSRCHECQNYRPLNKLRNILYGKVCTSCLMKAIRRKPTE